MIRLAWLVVMVAACGNDVGDEPPPRGIATPARVRLLTAAQYTNAVHDLLGAVDVPVLREPGARPHQFIHEDVLGVDAPLLVQFRIAAETVAAAVAPGTCTDEPCALAFAARAFRRPLEADERGALARLYGGGGFALVVEAVLQAPSFVYRTELGGEPDATGVVDLTPYEVAAELGFLLADSLPDPALWAAAGDGSLAREDVVAAHVERLLETPRVRAHLADVVLQWLDVYRVLEAGKDPAIFPELTPELRASMVAETRRFVEDVLWHRGGSLRELLTSRETFVDERLAAHYGRPDLVAGEQLVRVALPGGERGGVLTHASVLAMLATEQRESIIRRGMYVHDKLLCSPDFGRPPFGAIAAEAGFTHAMSEQQFSFFRTAHVYCSGCHTDIDPPGRALHHYDGLGRYRVFDTIDQPVESDGRLEIGGRLVAFDDALELGRALADSAHVARCVVDQLAHHALGRQGDPALRGFLHRRFEAADRDLVEVFRALATSPQFRRRRGVR